MLNLIVISGRKQSPLGSWTGTRELEELLRVKFAEYNVCCVRVAHFRHDANWQEVASDLALLRRRYKDEPFYNLCFPFSWGGGEGLPSLANELHPFGMMIHTAVTCDAIYKHFFYAGNWRVLNPKSRILMPDNVLRIIPFAQKQGIPMGRGIASTRLVEPMTYLDYSHVEMDSAPEWHDKCIQVAKEFAQIAIPGKKYIPPAAPDPERVRELAEVSTSMVKSANAKNSTP